MFDEDVFEMVDSRHEAVVHLRTVQSEEAHRCYYLEVDATLLSILEKVTKLLGSQKIPTRSKVSRSNKNI